jgi:hypothetical protein
VRIKEGYSMRRRKKPLSDCKARKKAIAFAAASYQSKPTFTKLKQLLELMPRAKHRPMF